MTLVKYSKVCLSLRAEFGSQRHQPSQRHFSIMAEAKMDLIVSRWTYSKIAAVIPTFEWEIAEFKIGKNPSDPNYNIQILVIYLAFIWVLLKMNEIETTKSFLSK